MLLTKEIEVVWNPTSRKHYESLGHIYTKHNDTFIVPVEHLMVNSNIEIDWSCDYCLEKMEPRTYHMYLKQLNGSPIKKDCCIKCVGLKKREIFEYKQNNNLLSESDPGYWSFHENRMKSLLDYLTNNGNKNFRKDKHGKKIYQNFHKHEHSLFEAVKELGFNAEDFTFMGVYDDFNDLENKIKEFITINNRFPTSSELINVLKIGGKIIAKHGGIYEIKRKMNYFDENDLVDNNLFVNYSLLEFYTAQFLIYHNVEYKREGLIVPTYNKKYRYDFYLIKNNTYTEIWGIDEKNGTLGKEYGKKRKSKEKLYKENNLKLLSIEPDDLKIHDITQVINKLTEIFSPYFTVKENIPHDIFISNKTVSDEDIIKQLTPYIDKNNYLPTFSFLIENELGHLTRLIRKRYGSYYKFAKKYGFKIRGKSIDVSEINEQIIYEMINEIFNKDKKDIEQKDLKKHETGYAIVKWINKNSVFDLFKVNYYKARLTADEIVDKSIFSFLIRFIRNSDYDVVFKNKCKNIINNLIQNEENKKIYNKVFQRLLARFPYTEQEYIDNFNKVILNSPKNITPTGFDMNSPMSCHSYINHYNGIPWLEIVKLMGKDKALHSYICNEFKEYVKQTGNCSTVEFSKQHPYITFNLMNYQDMHKWVEDAEIKNAKKNRYTDKDLEDNFLYIKNILNKTPLYHEFVEHTKISFNTYKAKFNLNKDIYDNIVRTYVNDEEYHNYLKEKKSYKTKLGKETGGLSRKHTDEDLQNNLITIFNEYKNKYGKYPSRREFANVSTIDERTYRKRLNMSWSQIIEHYDSYLHNS